MALERGEHRDAIAHAVCVKIAALLAVGAGPGEEVLAGPVGHLVPHAAVCASGTPPPPIVATGTSTSAPSSSRVGIAPDVTAGAIPLVRALGVGGGLG